MTVPSSEFCCEEFSWVDIRPDAELGLRMGCSTEGCRLRRAPGSGRHPLCLYPGSSKAPGSPSALFHWAPAGLVLVSRARRQSPLSVRYGSTRTHPQALLPDLLLLGSRLWALGRPLALPGPGFPRVCPEGEILVIPEALPCSSEGFHWAFSIPPSSAHRLETPGCPLHLPVPQLSPLLPRTECGCQEVKEGSVGSGWGVASGLDF